MQCLYCGRPLSLLRGLAAKEFCSRDHQQRYKKLTQRAFSRLVDSGLPSVVKSEPPQVRLPRRLPPPAPASIASLRVSGAQPWPGSPRTLAIPSLASALNPWTPRLAAPVPGVRPAPLRPLAAARIQAPPAPFAPAVVTRTFAALALEPLDLPAPIPALDEERCVEELSKMDLAAYRTSALPPHQIPAVAACASSPLLSIHPPIQPRLNGVRLTPVIPAGLAAPERVLLREIRCEPLAAPALAGPRMGIPAPVLPRMSIPEPAGLLPATRPQAAVPAGAILTVESQPASFAVPALRRPKLSAAPDRLALRTEKPIQDEVSGADAVDVPVGVPLRPNLGSQSVLPALASLFRYGRPVRSAGPLPHVSEDLHLTPRDRSFAAAAYAALPMPAQQPSIPRASGLRIVETFEYLRPMDAPPFDPWRSLVRLWSTAPVYLRFAAVSVGLILLFVATVPGGGAAHLAASGWNRLRTEVRQRAAVELAENFQGDMADWQGQGDWTQTWQKSRAGFVRPGRLALYQPSMRMSEYRVEFLAQVEKAAVGWAYRATDQENYYATKLKIVKPGSLPEFSLVRYPVIGGRAGPRVEVPIRVLLHNNTPYRVELTAKGDGFSTAIEGQLVDFWRDDNLKVGGFGFFSDTGERARVYWMRLSHQDDFIGRACAHFSPAFVLSEEYLLIL